MHKTFKPFAGFIDGLCRAWYDTPDASVALQYKTWAGLVTERGPVPITSGTLIVGLTYTITTYVAGDNFANVANVQSGVINTTGCVFIATGDTPTDYSHGSALVNDGVPTATVLFNSLGGDVTFSRDDVGDFRAICAGAFPDGSVVFPGGIFQTLSPSSAEDWILGLERGDVNYVRFTTALGTGGSFIDDALERTYIEIRVYTGI